MQEQQQHFKWIGNELISNQINGANSMDTLMFTSLSDNRFSYCSHFREEERQLSSNRQQFPLQR